MSTSTLTRPEQATERALAMRQMARILREGSMCSVCIHRQQPNPLKVDVCQTFGRSYPLCEKSPGKKFDPDHAALKGTKSCTPES
ncbi:hypothetical protein LQ772_06710 [Frateuria edaphi]|uniref:hypothetical protein n=1 Tax=Frateuria edaphi TaxID=2898793 RepID=UPI001E363423|nr:hypothetical protein [Frateuria edaphi]UGB46976.1 hypothetical protein LQ772_06710 [Frateuria edaphi]